jgi:hypothetical protein
MRQLQNKASTSYWAKITADIVIGRSNLRKGDQYPASIAKIKNAIKTGFFNAGYFNIPISHVEFVKRIKTTTYTDEWVDLYKFSK